MKATSLFITAAAGVIVFASGCTFPSSRRTVPAAQANVLQRSELGVVTSVRDVNIEGSKGQIGLYGGGVVGGALASGGKGVTGRVTQAAGAVTGAVVGQAVEEVATRKVAQEITIRLDDGSTVTVTQDVSSGRFMDGDRVRVTNGGGHARVSMAVN
jgi:outer membrane lipoprotein SlyB